MSQGDMDIQPHINLDEVELQLQIVIHNYNICRKNNDIVRFCVLNDYTDNLGYF